jgi:hypothetical protein
MGEEVQDIVFRRCLFRNVDESVERRLRKMVSIDEQSIFVRDGKALQTTPDPQLKSLGKDDPITSADSSGVLPIPAGSERFSRLEQTEDP